MKLSVLMITYNHEKFIAQALDSILMQEVDFDYEIVIGEDYSVDKTRIILCDYQRRYPDKIKLLLPDKNLGMMRNFVETYKACQGNYIAILEGDDYWISPYKLQKQVTFLDQHPDFVICFHNAATLWENSGNSESLLCPETQKSVSTLKDLISSNFIPTLTVMFRNRLFEEFPEWYQKIIFGDWALHIINSQYGNIGYLNENMAVYRIHSEGAASSARTDPKKAIDNVKGLLLMYRTIDCHFDYKYNDIVKTKMSDYYWWLAEAYGKIGDNKNRWTNAGKALLTTPNKGAFVKFIRCFCGYP